MVSANDFMLFSNWLNKILEQNIPKEVKAFNFNLYEGADNTYHIQLIGSNEFDEIDEDWACNETYTTGEDICCIARTKDIAKWEQGLNYIIKLVKQYLVQGENASILKKVFAVGVGFVDGNITIVYRDTAAKRFSTI